MSRTMLALVVLGAMLLCITAMGIWIREAAIGLLIAAAFVYLVAVFAVLRHTSSPHSLWVVLAVAAVMRLAFVFNDPVLSSDVYRYVWDGQVQNAGINPYRYVPTDPALSKLRDAHVFPKINRANYAHTIYPPAAQVVFAAVGRFTNTITGMKIAMVAWELVACLCMLKILAIAKLSLERVLIYAWNPLAQWSFAYDGHVDAIAIGLLGLALLARAQHRSGLAGGFLAGAALVKFLPLVAAPAFVRGEKFWRPALVGAFVVVLLYGTYASVGTKVLGFISGYDAEEGLTNGTGIWLLSWLSYLNDNTDWVDLPDNFGTYYLVAGAAFMAAMGLWIARRKLKPDETDVVALCRDTALLAACTMVLISPHYPWYFAWLALPAVVAPSAAVIWLSVAPVILYLDPGTEHAFWGSFIYLPAIGFAAVAQWKDRVAINAPFFNFGKSTP